ncbi:hypothetical protein EXS65_01710 [Candidatus Peribacteria bacterium]|nr:hypothetical protein [Candidatus Peribacteria bacterium]
MELNISNAAVIAGRSRGRRIGTPTINVDVSCAPKSMRHGIYACFILIHRKQYRGAMHYGPRPVFKDTETLEVHVLDAVINQPPKTVDIIVVGRIRDVRDFRDAEALQRAISEDIVQTRAMLDEYEIASQKALS